MTAIAYDPEVKRLCERIQRWEDHADERDGTCVKCGETIGGHEPEHEPSPLCNGCAQDLATRTFPDQLEAAGREVERLGGERDKAMADASQARFYLVDANDTADIACADLNKHLETMTAERDALRAEVERLEARLTTADTIADLCGGVIGADDSDRIGTIKAHFSNRRSMYLRDAMIEAVDAYRAAAGKEE